MYALHIVITLSSIDKPLPPDLVKNYQVWLIYKGS